MRSLNHIAIITFCIIMLVSCSKDDESYTEYPVPEWNVQSPELFPNSLTAVIALPENIDAYSSDDDLVAAFIGDECRGVGVLAKGDGNKRVWYITIRASDTEEQEIVFRYFNAALSYLYEATQRIAFEIDGTYGTYDLPIILDLEYL